MKRLNLFLVGLAALTLVFTSCEPTEKAAPVITFANGVTEATTNLSTYTVSGTITSEAGLESVTYTKETTAGTDQLSVVDKFDDKSSYSFQYDVAVSEDMTLIVTAKDKDGNETSRNFMITYTGGAASISSFTAILIGAQSNTTYGSALDVNSGKVYKLADAKTNSASVDILYYYGSTNKATFAAPDDETVDGTGSNSFDWTSSWGTKNSTKFGISSLTSSEFDAMTDDSELSGISGLSASKETDLAVGDVLEFTTAAGKNGALKVVSIDGAGSGTIKIDVKVQI